jgi:hypothetical protein
MKGEKIHELEAISQALTFMCLGLENVEGGSMPLLLCTEGYSTPAVSLSESINPSSLLRHQHQYHKHAP